MSTAIEKDGWKLLTKQGDPVHVGDARSTHHGNPLTILGGRPPHKPSSTGFVHGDGWEYYASVFDLVWVKEGV